MERKEQLMRKIARCGQAKQLLEKIAACSKSKSKKQSVRKISMSDQTKTAALLCVASVAGQRKTAGAASDAANGFMEGLTNMPKNMAGFVQRNAGALGSAAGTAALTGIGVGSAAAILAKILKMSSPGAVGLTAGTIAGGAKAYSDVEDIKKNDKARQIITSITEQLKSSPFSRMGGRQYLAG